MAISVMRHTNSTVKFWFIENFLSPSFLVSVLLPGQRTPRNIAHDSCFYRSSSLISRGSTDSTTSSSRKSTAFRLPDPEALTLFNLLLSYKWP